VPVIIDELRKSAMNIDQKEIDRARAQIRAQLLMGQESPAARAGQIARQMMLYGRPISNPEMMERLEGITVERLTDLAGRLFFDTVPTLSAIGPLEHLAPMEDIAASLSNARPGSGCQTSRFLIPTSGRSAPGVSSMPKSVFRFLSRQPEVRRD
jgi:hypothetical protein